MAAQESMVAMWECFMLNLRLSTVILAINQHNLLHDLCFQYLFYSSHGRLIKNWRQGFVYEYGYL